MGATAVILWSLSSPCIVFVGKRIGVWQFLAITSLVSGLLQIFVYIALGRRPRSILMPPPKIWCAAMLGFVIYLLLYTAGIVTSSTEMQTMSVNLMNYLWPTFTILFSIVLVPGETMNRRLAIAMTLSLAGVLLANSQGLLSLDTSLPIWPYVLTGTAAMAWGLYCALTSRWRAWAKDYAASPLGFLILGSIALGVCLIFNEWHPMNGGLWIAVIFTSLGPLATGYMLWEMAIHRVSNITLGLLGALIPVLSTLSLFGLYALTAPNRISVHQVAVLLISAALIGGAVALGTSSLKMQTQPNARIVGKDGETAE